MTNPYYFRFTDKKVSGTEEAIPGVLLIDRDAMGGIVGIEVLIEPEGAEWIAAEEREACAKTAEECQQGHQPLTPSGFVAKIAAAIRERGGK